MFLVRVCGACGSPGAALCRSCAARLEPAATVRCPEGAVRATAVLRFDGVGRDLVLGLKYRNRRDTVGPLADAMAAAVAPRPFDLISWAPTSAARRRGRGFDQARLLAVAVARRLGCPCRAVLSRQPGRPQTGLDAMHRHDSHGPAFVASAPVSGRVLLVDDVVTTGATLAAATAALRAAGAGSVEVLVAAATPLKDTSR